MAGFSFHHCSVSRRTELRMWKGWGKDQGKRRALKADLITIIRLTPFEFHHALFNGHSLLFNKWFISFSMLFHTSAKCHTLPLLFNKVSLKKWENFGQWILFYFSKRNQGWPGRQSTSCLNFIFDTWCVPCLGKLCYGQPSKRKKKSGIDLWYRGVDGEKIYIKHR